MADAASWYAALQKILQIAFLTTFQKYLFGNNLSEYHTGYRAFSRNSLLSLPLSENSDDFIFDNQMIAQAAMFGFRIGGTSCPTRYFEEASSINFRHSLEYGLGVLGTTASFVAHRLKVFRIPKFTSNGRNLLSDHDIDGSLRL